VFSSFLFFQTKNAAIPARIIMAIARKILTPALLFCIFNFKFLA
jgi:hypothetical protein